MNAHETIGQSIMSDHVWCWCHYTSDYVAQEHPFRKNWSLVFKKKNVFDFKKRRAHILAWHFKASSIPEKRLQCPIFKVDLAKIRFLFFFLSQIFQHLSPGPLFLPRLQFAPTSAHPEQNENLYFLKSATWSTILRIRWGPLHSSTSSSSSRHLSHFSSAWLWSGCNCEATDMIHSNHVSSLSGNALCWMRSADWVHGQSPSTSSSHQTRIRKWSEDTLKIHLRAPRLRFRWNFSHFMATQTLMKRPNNNSQCWFALRQGWAII